MDINNINSMQNDISKMIDKMREIADKKIDGQSIDTKDQVSNFSEVLKGTIEQVNNAQLKADALKEAYTKGDEHVTLAQVMLASQKSTIAFEGLLAVRNKVIAAYQDIMNMQV